MLSDDSFKELPGEVVDADVGRAVGEAPVLLPALSSLLPKLKNFFFSIFFILALAYTACIWYFKSSLGMELKTRYVTPFLDKKCPLRDQQSSLLFKNVEDKERKTFYWSDTLWVISEYSTTWRECYKTFLFVTVSKGK